MNEWFEIFKYLKPAQDLYNKMYKKFYMGKGRLINNNNSIFKIDSI